MPSKSKPGYHGRMAQLTASHIEVRPNHDGQNRAYIAGTRVRVQDVAMMAEVHGQTADQITDALPHLSLAQVHAALSYYFDHRDEVQQELKQDEQFVEQLKALRGPGLIERRLKSLNSTGDAIPSR